LSADNNLRLLKRLFDRERYDYVERFPD